MFLLLLLSWSTRLSLIFSVGGNEKQVAGDSRLLLVLVLCFSVIVAGVLIMKVGENPTLRRMNACKCKINENMVITRT